MCGGFFEGGLKGLKGIYKRIGRAEEFLGKIEAMEERNRTREEKLAINLYKSDQPLPQTPPVIRESANQSPDDSAQRALPGQDAGVFFEPLLLPCPMFQVGFGVRSSSSIDRVSTP
ncbi:hypothetical protein BO71DRAFT_170310 [Aspergillus ellipticus CBS 707.79]|uniref:Uncharacterized protein n=1 Tax=Aspergillus ellipticus CBS 707.79 TaxID=1448320 RepID=A0A319EFN9_9EURO|nr:hypothetical protein BO71DRAFT_170310 [Aspergillus ellipticus CBS 707.79]